MIVEDVDIEIKKFKMFAEKADSESNKMEALLGIPKVLSNIEDVRSNKDI